jgi:hypothetical protein
VSVTRVRCDDRASLGHLGYVIAQGARDGIERQASLDQAADKLKAAHLLPLISGNGPIGLGDTARHSLLWFDDAHEARA